MPTRGAICWTYWYSALISQILTPKSYHRLGVFDIFSVCRGTFCNLLEQIAISGVRSVPKNTNSATILKSSPAQFVLFDMPFHPDWLVGFKHFNHDVMMCHTCAVRCTRISIVAGQVKFSASVLHFNPNLRGWRIVHVKRRELSTYSECSYEERQIKYDKTKKKIFRFS